MSTSFSIQRANLLKEQGVTLFELFLVIALSSCGFGVILPVTYYYKQAQILQLTSAELMFFLERVQNFAHRSSQDYRVTVMKDKPVELQAVDENSSNRLPFGFRIDPPTTTLKENPESRRQVVFYGRLHRALANHFVIENRAGKVRVIVSTKGRIRRCLDMDAPSSIFLYGITRC